MTVERDRAWDHCGHGPCSTAVMAWADIEDEASEEAQPTGRSRSGSRERLTARAAFGRTELATGTAMDLFFAARASEAEQDLSRARALYRLAAAAEGFEVDALRACARVERELGLLVEAARTLIHALHHASEEPELSATLFAEIGDLQAELGDYGEAVYHYRRAARLAPADVTIARRLRSASGLCQLRLRSSLTPSRAAALPAEVDVDVSELDLAV